MPVIPETIKVIGFDADDTLWVNEPYYRDAEQRFMALLEPYNLDQDPAARLFQTEITNLPLYGYGIKSFTLSMVESAIQLTSGTVTTRTLQELLKIGKEMLQRPIELLEDVKPVLEQLAPHYRLIVATKGDLLDQERKMKRSSISSYFHHIEVMSDKEEQNYIQLLSHLDIQPCDFLMIGNSLRSDIIPPLNLGSWAVYIPFHTTWAHEEVESEPLADRYFRVNRLNEIPDLLLS